jgi:cell division protein FtsZ
VQKVAVARPAVAQAVQPRPAPVAEPDYGSALAAAMEQSEGHDPGVTIQPLNAAPASTAQYDEHEIDLDMGNGPAEEHVEVEMEAPFIPPQPEAPPSRMPRIEDFPAPVQRQAAARTAPAEEDRGPLSLLRRLAGVGLGRREEDPIGAGRPQQTQTRQQPQAARPAPQQQPRVQMPPPPPVPDYAKRPPQPRAAAEGLYKPRQGDLDPHGRPVPREQRADDELEIPAFLRRQAN